MSRELNMKRVLKLASKMILVLLTPQFALGQWTEGQEGQLVIRGGYRRSGDRVDSRD